MLHDLLKKNDRSVVSKSKEYSSIIRYGPTSYWELGRPRPQTPRQSRKICFACTRQIPKTVLTVFSMATYSPRSRTRLILRSRDQFMKRILLVVAVATLYILHQDIWF